MPVPPDCNADDVCPIATLPASVITTLLFCNTLPVVPSKRAMALSVEEEGQSTFQLQPHQRIMVCLLVQGIVLVYENYSHNQINFMEDFLKAGSL